MQKVGLVLEGGALRGIYVAGVLDYFLQAGIRFETVIGVSAGACNAVSYISRQPGRSALINCSYCDDKRYLGPVTYLTTGSFCGMNFMFHEIPDKLLPFDHETYEASPQQLTAVVLDAHTATPIYPVIRNCREDLKYVKASSSLPILSPPVVIDGKEYYDGGVTTAIPVEHSIAQGNEKNVVVLTHNRGYIREPSKLERIYRLRYGKSHPALCHALIHRHEEYNKQLAHVMQLEQQGKAFVLMPTRPVEVGRFTKDRDKLLALYYNGVEDARASYKALRSFCAGAENVTFERENVQ